MAHCADCGGPLSEGQDVCPSCGRPAATSPPAGTGGQQGWHYYPQAERPPSPPRRSRMGMWIGIGAAVVVVAVACGLVFGVFKADIFGGDAESGDVGTGGASSPEQAVRELLTAYENEDMEAIFALIDPVSMSSFLQGQSQDLAKQLLRAALFAQGSVKFSGIELSPGTTDATTATVAITAGTLTVTGPDGRENTFDVSAAGGPLTIGLVKRDGSWYIDANSVALIGAGLGGAGSGINTGGSSGPAAPEETVPQR